MKKHKFLKKKQKKPVGKKLCIFLVVVFTLVMIADIANLFLTPAQNQMGFGPGGFSMPGNGDVQMPDGMEMPEGGDFQMPEGMEMPSGGDFQMPNGGEMPGGDFQPSEGMEMPVDGEFQMPDRNASENADGENSGEPSFEGRPVGNRGGGQMGILQTLRSAWIPILIVCAVGDLICLIILIRIRRKEKALEQAFDEESGMPPLMEEEEDPDEPPRRKHGSWIIIVCLAVAFAMILSMFPTGEESASTSAVHKELISGTAEAAQINTVLSGAGTLEADTLTPVTVPQQVTVLNYHVRNGETVVAGDPLVSVDKTSAASAMMELNELMEELDGDLSSAKTDSQSARIASTTSGRVKKIYGWEGDKVADVLYEHGALMLLSLDGTMKVTFASGLDLSVGDTVEVQYSGGMEEGRIASIRQGKVTVTISDKSAPYGAEALVLNEEGKAIGQGKLEISSEMKVIGYYGTIEQVRVDVNDKVTADNTLFSLENVGYTTEYQILLARRNELEKQLQTLSQLAKTGMIYAENDGVISGVPDDADIQLLSASDKGTVTVNNLSSTSGGWKIVLLSSSNETFEPTKDIYYAAKVTAIDTSSVQVVCVPTPEQSSSFDPATYDNGQMTQSYQLDITLFQSSGVPQAESYLIFRVTENADGTAATTVTIPSSGESGGGTETKLNGTYAAKLVNASGGSLYVWLNPTAGNYSTVDLSTLEAQMTQFGGYSYAPGINNNDITLTTSAGNQPVKLANLKTDDLLVLYFQDDMIMRVDRAQRTAAQQPQGPSQGQDGQFPGGTGGMPSGGSGDMVSGSGGMPSGGISGGMPSGMGGSFEQTYDNYIVEETELLYVSDQTEVSVTISIDELDILSVAVGMEVQVTLDAVKGRSFTGEIIRKGHEGTNDGGNTKYEVTILLPRAAVMLDGMNASVSIVTGTSDAAVTIPAAALVEEDGKTYVYTTYDVETDTLGGLVEVETGASDGENVEILSGLESGDTYHYLYADTVTYNFLSSL